MRTGMPHPRRLPTIGFVALIGSSLAYVPAWAAPAAFPFRYLPAPGPAGGRQALIALAQKPDDIRVKLYLLEASTEGWSQAGAWMEAVVGHKGIAPPGEKREGDGRTPSGRFEAGFAFGYAPRVRTRWPYRQLTGTHFWNTDPASPEYNTWLENRPQAASYEEMLRRDRQYKLGVVIRYNMDPVVPGLGSAIFLHVWRGPGLGTAGCIGVSERNMLRILRWLDPAGRPMFVMGTEAMLRENRL